MVGYKWNRWEATNIHLDHSSSLRNQWSPLPWSPPWDEENFTKLGPWWTTCLGAGVGQLWQPDTVGSIVGECSWFACPWYNLWWPVPCSLDLTLLVWVLMQCQRCPIEVGSRDEGGQHWILGADQGMVEYWAQGHCSQQTWWWCMTHIRVGEACGGV